MKQVVFHLSVIVCIFYIRMIAYAQQGIHIYEDNPTYWQYNNKPMLLLGGSDDDNLYQWEKDKLLIHLKEMKSVGANYIRSTMSYRDEGNEIPFVRLENGKFDLDRINPKWEERFRFCLKECSKRGIVVQVEIWATYDLWSGFWSQNPFNPMNNVTYDSTEVTLPVRINRGKWPGSLDSTFPFYFTIPELNDDKVALKYQQKFVDAILDISLQYDNVLYCIDNEIWYNSEWEWGWYWAKYIKDAAQKVDKKVYVAEMYCFAGFNPNHGERGRTFVKGSFDHPEIYDYLDISQTSYKRGQDHWDFVRKNYEYCRTTPRPINMVKIYGSDENDAGHCTSEKLGIEVFWRTVFAGLASARFHRPSCGQGLNELARKSIHAMRLFEKEIRPWECQTAMDLLSDRETDEAYALAQQDQAYAVYFTNTDTADGQVTLDLTAAKGRYTAQWMDVEKGVWIEGMTGLGSEKESLIVPGPQAQYGWVCVLKRE